MSQKPTPITTHISHMVRCDKCGALYEPPFQQHVCPAVHGKGGDIVVYSGNGEVLLRIERPLSVAPTPEELTEFEALRKEIGMDGIAALLTEAMARKLIR